MQAGIAAAVADAMAAASTASGCQVATAKQQSSAGKKERPPSKGTYSDGTTGLNGCELSVPKYSKRLKEQAPRDASNQASEQRRGRSVRKSSPRATTPREVPRTTDKCHADLYEDAFARQARLKDMQSYVSKVEETEQRKRVELAQEKIKERRKYYKGNGDNRSHLEREQEILRRRQEKAARLEEERREKEIEELRACTFRPCLVKKLSGLNSQGGSRPQSPRGNRSSAASMDGSEFQMGEPGFVKLQQLVKAQQRACEKLRALDAEEQSLSDRLNAELEELSKAHLAAIRDEETAKIVSIISPQERHPDSGLDEELIQRVHELIYSQFDPGTANARPQLSCESTIVEDLVKLAEGQVDKRVKKYLTLWRQEAEGEMYSRRLSVAHELEALEAKVLALRGGTLVKEASSLGFDFDRADQVRRDLKLGASRPLGGQNGSSLGGISAASFPAHGIPVTSSAGNSVSVRAMSETEPSRSPSVADFGGEGAGAANGLGSASGASRSRLGDLIQADKTPTSYSGNRGFAADPLEATGCTPRSAQGSPTGAGTVAVAGFGFEVQRSSDSEPSPKSRSQSQAALQTAPAEDQAPPSREMEEARREQRVSEVSKASNDQEGAAGKAIQTQPAVPSLGASMAASRVLSPSQRVLTKSLSQRSHTPTAVQYFPNGGSMIVQTPWQSGGAVSSHQGPYTPRGINAQPSSVTLPVGQPAAASVTLPVGGYVQGYQMPGQMLPGASLSSPRLHIPSPPVPMPGWQHAPPPTLASPRGLPAGQPHAMLTPRGLPGQSITTAPAIMIPGGMSSASSIVGI
eukprot:TRINITY_DN12456_c0_g1_i2.p1 TRINITY_DN12456_c0_g1~~TRINITY_DN12456_c0_g1_i2.p1  ORF type:complete len:905 (-),score=128.08 TRINITY_DN12456_c0_g1_i2:83-2497(-)